VAAYFALVPASVSLLVRFLVAVFLSAVSHASVAPLAVCRYPSLLKSTTKNCQLLLAVGLPPPNPQTLE
jgi:hypothetical protein